MMIPSLRESSDEFIQNIPLYVEEIGRWWAGVVQFAAKYNIILPEYAINSDLLIEKVTTLISDEESGILTVTWGAATSVLSVLVDVLLGLVFALYLLAKKEVIAAHLKKLIVTVFPQKEGAAASEHCYSDKPDLYQLCQRTAYGSGYHRRSVLLWNADPWDSVCRCGLRVCGCHCADADFWRMDWRRLWCVFDSAGGTWQGSVVHSLLLILQQVEGNLIYPKVVGKSVGLPGLLVLMAVTIGGEAFGILGCCSAFPSVLCCSVFI